MRTKFLLILLLFSLVYADAQTAQELRSFGDIFPNLPPAVQASVFSKDGYNKTYVKIPQSGVTGYNSGIDPGFIDAVFAKQPGFLVETITVIPGNHALLDVYNALGKIKGLKGRLYSSFSRKEDVVLFEEVTRIDIKNKNTPLEDPLPAGRIPSSETVYVRLKDINFGISFYRADMTLDGQRLHYSLTNYKNITYFLVPVIKEERFTAQLYFEPIAEGILIYGLSGADVSDFVSSKIDMTSAINKRLSVILSWVMEGITG